MAESKPPLPPTGGGGHSSLPSGISVPSIVSANVKSFLRTDRAADSQGRTRNFYDDIHTPVPDDSGANLDSTALPLNALNAPAGASTASAKAAAARADSLALLQSIWRGVIGANDAVETPFGPRKITYADYTASGRALSFIEDYIRQEVLPLYANTHTLSDATGLQTTLFRQEARDIIKRAVRGSIHDTVLFCGSGATACVDTAVRLLQLREMADAAKREHTALPVVLVGPYEHHSNLLPWRESGAIVITIPETPAPHTAPNNATAAALHAAQNSTDNNSMQCIGALCRSAAGLVTFPPSDNTNPTSDTVSASAMGASTVQRQGAGGGLDRAALEAALAAAAAAGAPLIVGSFSAASNVTGALEDTVAVTAMLKRYGALSCWDYAGAGPYVPIDMNPDNNDALRKDLVFLSPHKLVGGVSTPGVLVAAKGLLARRAVPVRPGGGTVLWVGTRGHEYLANLEEKEEGGTPEIVGAIRAGLVFQLKQAVGPTMLARREKALAALAHRAWRTHPHILLLGNTNTPLVTGSNAQLTAEAPARLPILSFAVRYAPDPSLLLHHNFVAALLNDLFGIQARAGCACAGPYVQSLMGISTATGDAFLSAILEKQEVVRPGMVRVSLSYFAPRAEAAYILRAVRWVASRGWLLLPLYAAVTASGEFRHRARLTKTPERRWLGSISYKGGAMTYESRRAVLAATSTENATAEHVSSSATAGLASTVPTAVPVPVGASVPAPLTPAAAAALFASYEAAADALVDRVVRGDLAPGAPGPSLGATLTATARSLRWFAFPDEAAEDVRTYIRANSNSNNNANASVNRQAAAEVWPWAANAAPQPVAVACPSVSYNYHIARASTTSSAFATTGESTSDADYEYDCDIASDSTASDFTADAAAAVAAVAAASELPSRWLGRVQLAVAPQRAYRAGTQCIDAAALPACVRVHAVTSTSNNNTTGSSAINIEAEAKAAGANSPRSSSSSSSSMSPSSGSSVNPPAATDLASPPSTDSASATTPSVTAAKETTATGTAVATNSTAAAAAVNERAKGVAYNKGLDLEAERHRLPIQKYTALSDTTCQNCFHEHRSVPNSSNTTNADNNNTNSSSKQGGKNAENPDASSSSSSTPANASFSRECVTCECVSYVPRSSALAATDGPTLHRATLRLARTVLHAVREFDMLREGDRILVGVSGGKDSLALLHLLLYTQRRSKVRFHIGAATVDPQTPEYDPSLLKRYFAALGVPYHYSAVPVMSIAKKQLERNPKISICAFCSRMRRGILYSTCRTFGYNVLALGQHMDDLAESFVMNAFHNGAARTMKPHYSCQGGDLRIIRPLCFIREWQLREFAKAMGLPVISENCPACFEAPKERQRVKLMLAAQEAVHPALFNSLQIALMPMLRATSLGVTISDEQLFKDMKISFGALKDGDGDDDGGDGNGNDKGNGNNSTSSSTDAAANTETATGSSSSSGAGAGKEAVAANGVAVHTNSNVGQAQGQPKERKPKGPRPNKTPKQKPAGHSTEPGAAGEQKRFVAETETFGVAPAAMLAAAAVANSNATATAAAAAAVAAAASASTSNATVTAKEDEDETQVLIV